jgi:hypothetical protein
MPSYLGINMQRECSSWYFYLGRMSLYLNVIDQMITFLLFSTSYSVRHVTGTGSGLLGESPEWLFRYLLLLKGPL